MMESMSGSTLNCKTKLGIHIVHRSLVLKNYDTEGAASIQKTCLQIFRRFVR